MARYVSELSFDEIPDDVVQFTKLCILDYFSSAIAGMNKAPAKIIAQYIDDTGGKEQATLINGRKSSVVNAALFNGATSHIVELDDIHKASIVHGAAVIIPPALAIAEWKGRTGKELLEAVISGYEISFRIGEVVSPSHYYYFHNTATCGTFGAAIASAKLLKLDEEKIIMTLGSAGTQAAGLWEFIEDGAMSKQLHTGKAAQNGLLSALLAEKGFTGATKILEGNRGFIRAMSDAKDFSALTENLTHSYKITENSFKIHASCRHVHAAMDLALQLHKEIELSDVQQIKINTYKVAINITDNSAPKTVYEAKFSIQFCVALALVYGESDYNAFTERRLLDENIIRVMNKITVEKDETIDRHYPEKWGTKLIVSLKDGTSKTVSTQFPKGDPENPVTEADLIRKFHILAGELEEVKRRELLDKIFHLEEISSVEQLMQVLRN